MKLENGYLSDEDLEQLILEVEEHELVAAPPSLIDKILTEVERQEDAKVEVFASRERKVKEFRRYCIRVITSAAAAVAIVFLAPNMKSTEVTKIPSRQELIGTSITREEALNDAGVFTQILNSLNNKIGG